MKKTNSNTEPETTIGDLLNPKILETKHDKILEARASRANSELPTLEQLTKIAATLARNTDDEPEALADSALKLWFASRGRIRRAVIDAEAIQHDYQLDEMLSDSEYNRFFSADKYPIPRDRFLQVMFPQFKNRTANLAEVAKSFLKWAYQYDTGQMPSPEIIANLYGEWQQKPFQNPDQANTAARRFERWYTLHIKQIRRTAGKSKKTRKARPPVEKSKLSLPT